jgi:PHP domain
MPGREHGSALVDVSAVVHLHTTYSDGTATVDELVAAAAAAGVDLVLVTDHDSLGARRDGWEGRHDGVSVLVGTEVSPKQGHYLAFGVDRDIPHAGRSALQIAAAVREADGVGFAAHPFSSGGHMLSPGLARRIVLPHGWPALDDPQGCDGVELWSLTTDAAEAWRTPAEAVRWLRDPERAIATGPPPHHLRRWDALSRQRRLPAIGGLDGHQPGVRVRGRVRSPLPHWRTFDLLRTHLLCERPLTGDVEADWRTVLAALAGGAAWLTCPCVAPADGARLWAERSDGAVTRMGGEGRAGPSVLRVRLPREADVSVVRDGEPFRQAVGAKLDVDLEEAGVYRVEARIDGRLWLLSNPVHLRAVSAGASEPAVAEAAVSGGSCSA